MSEEPYSPCDERDPETARTAKIWELLRRNERFKEAFRSARNGVNDGSWPDRFSKKITYWMACDVLRMTFGRKDGLRDFWRDPSLVDLPAPEAGRRIYMTFGEALYMDDWRIYVSVPDETEYDPIWNSGARFCDTDTSNPDSYKDHYIALIPRSVPSPGHIKILTDTIERLVKVTGKNIRKADPGGSDLGTQKDWEAYLAYEAQENKVRADEEALTVRTPWIHPGESEMIEAVLRTTLPEHKIRNARGKFKERRQKILDLIEAAYPA